MDHHDSDADLFELLHTPGITWETKFHWLKIKWIKEIEIDHKLSEINLKCFGSSNSTILDKFLPEIIIEDIQEKFARIRNILIKGKISFFTKISHSFSGRIQDRYVNEMELVKCNIELEELSSASEAYNTILNTLINFSKSRYNSFGLIKSYFKSIQEILGKRPCHVLIRELNKEIEDILENINDHDIFVQKIKQIAENRKEQRINIENKITENSKLYIRGTKSILVYGYSTMVLNALKSATSLDKKNCIIYVAECRGKTQFNDQNKMVYNDGINYVEKLKEMKFKNIHFVADIAIGNLMKRKLIKKVFFGANGIDRETGSFGHTCGHLSIADLAHIYGIPVYVVSDTSKIGDLKWEAELERDINWLPNYRKYEKILRGCKLINPREDIVESDRVDVIITEKGPKLLKEIKDI
jgi:translation initiation factor 2B subunit (eIF-2B alpha/beta/delta family)